MKTTINIHVNDKTKFKTKPVSNFVILRIGKDVDVFLTNAEQAAALADAAADAFALLKKTSSPVDEMLEAGKAWVYHIRGEDAQDFTALKRWNLKDWKVVMERFGPTPTIVITQEFLDDFKRGCNV